jgi:23S rRNA (uridine2552-2'-O)-methyltransferase
MANYTKPDFWALKAQKDGYPARSVYKLQEIDAEFGVFRRRPCKVLDLGAAPGSWSLYVQRLLGAGGAVTAADIAPLSRAYDKGGFDAGNFFYIQGDVTDAGVRERVLACAPFHVVLSDMAPATTGNRSIDTARSLELAEAALSYAAAALTVGGNFVVKVFQGGDSVTLLRRLRELFTSAKSFKPKCCRRESFETYYLGMGLRSRYG